MNLSTKMMVGAVLKLVVRKADTDEIVGETPEFHNLVLTTGLARMAVGTWIDRCCLGTGNSNPVASQVALDSLLASTTATASGEADTGGIQVTTAPYYWFGRRTWRFAVGVATGNISEVGLGWGNTTLWNRALVKDIEGNPTTITVLADEYLDVISEVRVYPSSSTSSINLVDKVGNVISTHEVKIMPYFLNATWDASAKVTLGGINEGFRASSNDMPLTSGGLPAASVGGGGISQTVVGASIQGKFAVTSSQLNFQQRTLFTNIAGFMTVRPFTVDSASGFKWQFDPAIPKDAETILTYSLTLTWGNYAPE